MPKAYINLPLYFEESYKFASKRITLISILIKSKRWIFVCKKDLYFRVFAWKKTAIYCILTWLFGFLANPNTLRN